jgi:hypothetical protein
VKGFFGNPFIEWLVFVIAVMGGIIAIKYLLDFLPDAGVLGGIKQVAMAA